MKLNAVFPSLALVPTAAFAAIDTTPFKMIAVSANASIDGVHLKATERFFFLGRETNSTCGDVDPILAMGDINGTLTMYRSPTANYSQTGLYKQKENETCGNTLREVRSVHRHFRCFRRPLCLQLARVLQQAQQRLPVS